MPKEHQLFSQDERDWFCLQVLVEVEAEDSSVGLVEMAG